MNKISNITMCSMEYMFLEVKVEKVNDTQGHGIQC